MKNGIERALGNLFLNWLENDGANFSGVFSVKREGMTIYQNSKGYRNKSEKLDILNDTKFAVASITKFFTSLSILKLAERKKLSVTDTLDDVLPYDLGKINRQISIKQLLNHTSGVGDYTDDETEDIDAVFDKLYASYPSYLWTNMDYYLQMSKDLEPKFNPGERMSYSNTGYVLLGLIIEKLSGVSYQEFVETEIIKPLNLLNTGFHRLDRLPGNTALGYIDELTTSIFSVPIIGGSDGGIFTTADDLDLLWRAVYGTELITEDSLKMLIGHKTLAYKNALEQGDTIYYGLGLYLYETENGVKFSYVAGYDAGADCISIYCPKNQITITVLSNVMDVAKYTLVKKAMEIFIKV